jgi:hypothetical protein
MAWPGCRYPLSDSRKRVLERPRGTPIFSGAFPYMGRSIGHAQLSCLSITWPVLATNTGYSSRAINQGPRSPAHPLLFHRLSARLVSPDDPHSRWPDSSHVCMFTPPETRVRLNGRGDAGWLGSSACTAVWYVRIQARLSPRHRDAATSLPRG